MKNKRKCNPAKRTVDAINVNDNDIVCRDSMLTGFAWGSKTRPQEP